MHKYFKNTMGVARFVNCSLTPPADSMARMRFVIKLIVENIGNRRQIPSKSLLISDHDFRSFPDRLHMRVRMHIPKVARKRPYATLSMKRAIIPSFGSSEDDMLKKDRTRSKLYIYGADEACGSLTNGYEVEIDFSSLMWRNLLSARYLVKQPGGGEKTSVRTQNGRKYDRKTETLTSGGRQIGDYHSM
jgi:hypothetical protein